MEFEALVEVVYWLVPWAICVIVGMAAQAATGTMSIVGRRTPAVLGALGMGIASLGAVFTVLVANQVAGSEGGEAAWKILLGGAMVRFVAWFGAVILGLLALFMFAVAGIRRTPRSTSWALGGLLGGALREGDDD